VNGSCAILHDLQQSVLIALISTNEAHNLVGCLRSLSESYHRNFRVIICENGGSEGFQRTTTTLGGCECVGTLEHLPVGEQPPTWAVESREFVLVPDQRRITVLKTFLNLGYAGGVNACIAAAGEWQWDAVWVLNPDTFPEPGALAALARRQAEGSFGIVGSRLISASSNLVQTWGGLEWCSLLGRGRYIGADQPADMVPNVAEIERRFRFISGASMYVSRAYVSAIGGMDEDFFVYDEDVDWCLRRGAFKLGYAHESVVRHIHGATSGSSMVKSQRSRFNVYLEERNRVLLARKRFGAKWAIFAAIALAQTMEHLLVVGSVRQFRIALEGWWAGVCGEKGAPAFIRERWQSNQPQFEP
jgi:N-acetylglucosaminyl-diphospho-decaprenol L-rhamnosyltransferase